MTRRKRRKISNDKPGDLAANSWGDLMGAHAIELLPPASLIPNPRNSRLDYPTLKAKVRELATAWNAQRVLVEDAGAGMMLAQELKGLVAGLVEVRPEGDKATRMAAASAKFESGQAFLPERAHWLADLEAELFAFPGSRHDDQCDSISQALLDDNLGPFGWLTSADWEKILTMSKNYPWTPRRRL